MKHFNPAIANHLYKMDFLLTESGMYIILKFKKRRIKFLKRQNTFIGKIYFNHGYKTFDERFDVIRRWESQINFDELEQRFFDSGSVKRPIIYFGKELKIDFNMLLEEIFDESLLENSWKKQWED